MAYQEFENIGNVDKFALLHKIIAAIFDKSIDKFVWDSQEVHVGTFRSKQLRYIDMEDRRYIQQNPNTGSQAAARARKGAKIIWVMRGNQYIGRIEDGQVYAVPEVVSRKAGQKC